MATERDLLDAVNQTDPDIAQNTVSEGSHVGSYIVQNKESWDAFVKYVLEDVEPQWMNEQLFSEEQKAEIIQQLESMVNSSEHSPNISISVHLLQYFMKFEDSEIMARGNANAVNFNEAADAQNPIDSMEFGESFNSDIDLSTLEANFEEDSNLLDQMSQIPDQEPNTSADLDMNYDQLSEPNFFDRADEAFDESPSYKVEMEETEEESASPEDKAAKDKAEKQEEFDRLAAMQQQMQQQPAYAEGQQVQQSSGGMAALGSMVGSIMRSGAHLAKGVENVTAPIATWGIEQTKKITEELATGSQLINQSIDKFAGMNEEQMAAHNQNFREGHLASNISSIADVMTQVREMMANFNQPSANSPMSLIEMNEQVKSTDNPKMAEFFKGQIKEALLEKGAESILETTETLIHANSLMEKYLENGNVLAEKVGESLEESLGSEFEAYQGELKEGEEIISEIAAMAEEMEVLQPEQASQIKESIEALKESIAALIKNIKGMFSSPEQNAAVSGPNM